MSPRLAMHLLGPPQLKLDGQSIHLERRKSLALLAYLAVEGGEHQRDFLSSLLWPDTNQSNAFKNLRQVLWEIQQSLGDGWLLSNREEISLRPDPSLWLDVQEFLSRTRESLSHENVTLRIRLLGEAARLYRNHFLTGFSLKDAHPFNDWAFAESEGLRHQLAGALTRLSQDLGAQGQIREAIPHARRLVSLDPLDESAHRLLMEIYLQAGQHSAALKQYETCEQILRKELNLDPQPETRELYKKIRKGELKPVPVEKRIEPADFQNNLPHQLSTFIGRQREQKEISRLLESKRLVTLVGAGGIGKTRLALQAGQGLLEEYPHGVWWIGLDSLTDPALLTHTVASVFGIREGGDRSLVDRLTNFLGSKSALLIFDNCEHLLDACVQLVTVLLTRCPSLKILATSRESLGIPGEAVYTMPSLPLPEGDVDSLETQTGYESVQLFAERAGLALTSFQLTQDNIQTVVDICRKVDGIPLAIELAAARLSVLSVDEILEQLQKSIALLSSSNRIILPRHQTLRASIEWSWSLLSEAEKRFLSQLSAFAGGWTFEAAQAVCDGDVLELTSVLVRKSLIMVNQEPGRGTRYHFHEMVREVVHEKSHESDDDEKIHARHLKYFMDLAEKAEHELRGPSRVDWTARLTDERNNIRVALHWADQRDDEAGMYLSARLRRYWEISNLPEGERWLKTFLQKTDSEAHPRARAQALLSYGWLLTWLQKFDDAYGVTDESLGLFRAAGDQEGEVDALILLENILQFKDRLEASIELGKQALALSQSLGDLWREANSLDFLGWGYTDSATRFAYWEQAIHLYRQVGDTINLANLLGLLGQFQVMGGDIESGEKNLNEALAYWESNKKASIWENPKITKSLIALHYGKYEEAQALLEEVMASAEQTGNRMSYLWAQVRLGYVLYQAGSLTEARRLLSESARGFARDGYAVGAVFAVEGLAGLSATVGKMERAARLIGWTDAMREQQSDPRPPREQADVDLSIAASIAKIGREAFIVEYEAGKKMSLDEAVAYAIDENP